MKKPDEISRPFSICGERSKDAQIVRIRGCADMHAIEALQRTLLELVPAGVSDTYVLDLSELSFIASDGIGAMIAAYRRAIEAGGAFRRVKAPDSVEAIFKVTHIASVIPPHASVGDALNAKR